MAATSRATLVVGGVEIPDITSFTYTSDIRQLGCPFALRIPDPRSKWRKVVTKGALVKLYLQNREVNNNAKTLKVTGRVREVEQDSENGQGSLLSVQGVDLGWHLTKSCGPLWFNLQRCTYLRLMQEAIAAGQQVTQQGAVTVTAQNTWGFSGYRAGNDLNRRLKLGRAQAVLAHTANNEVPVQYIGIEPGEKLADVLIDTFRRIGLLINVSADGYLQGFNPNYTQNPLYALEYHARTSSDFSRNNIKRARVLSSADPLWTEVVCVGEVVILPDQVDPRDAHPGKFRGRYRDDSVLPFRAPATFADAEQLTRALADRKAKWYARQGQYDAWTYQATMQGHHQGGVWWEADTMSAVIDTVNVDDGDPKNVRPIKGRFYVAAIQQGQDNRGGDVTTLTIKRPNLLSAL